MSSKLVRVWTLPPRRNPLPVASPSVSSWGPSGELLKRISLLMPALRPEDVAASNSFPGTAPARSRPISLDIFIGATAVVLAFRMGDADWQE